MKNISLSENKKLLIVLGLGVLLNFSNLSVHSYELDESFSLFVSRNWLTMTSTLWNREANMWLYYILLHFWQILGTNEFWVRGLSAFFALLSSYLVYKIAEYLFDKKVGVLASLLLVVNMYFVFYAQQARSYSLALFLVCLSLYSYLRYPEEKKYKLFYILSSSLSVYAHFYTLFVLFVQTLLSIFHKRFKIILPALLSIGIIILPEFIAPSFLNRHWVDWIDKPSLESLVGTVFALFGDFVPLVLIYGFLFMASLKFVFNSYKEFKIRLLINWLFLPILLSFAFSWIFKPIYQSVYFLICLPPFVILSAVFLRNISNDLVRKGVITLIIILSLIRLNSWFGKDNGFKSVFNNNPEAWRSLVNFVSANSKQGDAVVFYGYYNRFPYELYSYSENPREVEIASNTYIIGTKLPSPNVDLIAQFEYQRIWLVLRNTDEKSVDYSENMERIVTSLDKKYQIATKTEFPELEVDLYVRRI